MREYVLLDSGPLGNACRRRGSPMGDQCRLWLDGLLARGVDIVVPEITDYEVRRELTRVGASGSLRRLDALVTTGGLTYAPITTLEWRQAAVFWADARRRGLPPLPRRSMPTSSSRLARPRSANRVITSSSRR